MTTLHPRQQPTPQSARIPPDVPSDPGISSLLSAYLRNFALWCRDGFAEQMRNNQALRGVMLMGYDTPAGETPPVWMLEASVSGTLALAPVALGSGKVGDPVAVGQTMNGPTSIVALPGDPEGYAYLAFYSPDYAQRYGYVGHGGAEVRLVNDTAGVALAMRDDGVVEIQSGGFQTHGWNTFFQVPGTIAQTSGGSFMVQGAGGGSDAFMTFHEPGVYATNFGISGGTFYFGGWSAGATTKYQFWTSRDFAHPLAAIEELQAKVATLEARLAALEARR